jgi:hypothetical protein
MLSALAARGLPRIAGPRGELNDHLPPGRRRRRRAYYAELGAEWTGV